MKTEQSDNDKQSNITKDYLKGFMNTESLQALTRFLFFFTITSIALAILVIVYINS